jgi:type IV pilus assembly protein PilB
MESRKKIGELLIEAKKATREQIDLALREQAKSGKPLGTILVEQGVLSEPDLVRFLSEQLAIPVLDPTKIRPDPQVAFLIPRTVADRHNVLPLARENGDLVVVMADPLDLVALDDIRSATQSPIRKMIGRPADIERLRDRVYREQEGTRNIIEAMDKASVEVSQRETADDDIDTDDAVRKAEDAPVVELVRSVITQAIFERATDIHVEPTEQAVTIRFRVDGLLYDALTPPKGLATGLLTRIKILANMDIAERRKPQDGRFSVHFKGKEVDVRVSTLPCLHGEKAVLRLLDKTAFDLDLTKLGFEADMLAAFRRAIHQPYGMVILSGPTGAGKSTTLYAALGEVKSTTLNVTTIEDPIEYMIPRINQVQVNPRKELTFATALRYMMRQDPDVIMVGEIRDTETAEMAVRAAMTGHIVFSTVHANDAPSTATRLVTMGVEPFQAASALSLVVAQRLVRRICPHCRTEVTPPEEKILGLGLATSKIQPEHYYEGKGCQECRMRKYLGRVAIFEMLEVDAEVKDLIAERAPAQTITQVATRRGMLTLRESGLRKIGAGITTVDEVLRVCLQEG